MLHKETVKPGTLDLISRLMKDQVLQSFYLVGGTALALKLGHRESIDIDMFNSSGFSGDELATYLQRNYSAQIKRQKENYISGTIGQVDFDFITHAYPLIKPIERVEGIRMLSNEDIAAMKINAMDNSGQRIKDFIDIHYLFNQFSCAEIIGFYCTKYPNVAADRARSALLYHSDIDFNVPVILKDNNLKWGTVRDNIIAAVKIYDQGIANQQFVQQLKQGINKNQNDNADRPDAIPEDEAKPNVPKLRRGPRR